MSDSGLQSPERPGLERRRSKNPLKSMMQHLSVESAEDDYAGGSPRRRESLMRRLSRRKSKSRSPSAHSDSSLGGDPSLCRACGGWAADVEAVFDEADASFAKTVAPGSSDVFDKSEQFLMRLHGLDENRWASTCPLCRLFWAVHVPSEGEGDYYLAAFSSRDMNYLIDPAKMHESGNAARGKDRGYSPAFLGVVPKKTGPEALGWDVNAKWFQGSGMIYRTLPEGLSRSDEKAVIKRGIWGREIAQIVDMTVAREWLQYCESSHQGRCGRRPLKVEMPGFRLVDCLRSPPQVVEASLQENYVALSYVRGKSNDPWPQIARDAAVVVKELGLRYLWIDRLCVDEKNPQVRLAQMARMDEIFEGAVVTIIAASAQDATHGLPGVGPTPRPMQPKYKFGNADITLVSSLPDPRLSITDSAWSTRAWTYQEALLSRRRLIFTEQQMYWECEGMACPETLVMPLEQYHDAEDQRMADFVRPGSFNGVSFMDGAWEVWRRLPGREEPSTLSVWRELDQHIARYTTRALTYDEDSLNAFLGITRRVEKTLGRGRLASVVGIPLWAPPSDGSDGRQNLTRDLFALTTSFWHHKDGAAARRRAALPSWTWAGWAGSVELFSSVVVRQPGNKARDRKLHNHHYVSATHLARGSDASKVDAGPAAPRWTYSPDLTLLYPDDTPAYDFAPSAAGPPRRLPPLKYKLRVSNPLVLDRVKAGAQPSGSGWRFNEISVDARVSGAQAAEGIRGYVQRHGRGEQMTVLWFVDGATAMLLVVERAPGTGGGGGGQEQRTDVWERVGRMRMGLEDEVKGLEDLLARLPLRRLGGDFVLE